MRRRQCIYCETEFEVPETMNDVQQCYPCWNVDTDRCFGKIEPLKINWFWVIVGIVFVLAIIFG